MSDSSPKKKKPRLRCEVANQLKRENDQGDITCKRLKSDGGNEEENIEKKLQALKRKNFVTACEQVSFKAYFDYYTRLQLVYLPTCINGDACKHHDYKTGTNIKEMPAYAEESFNIEMKTNMWYEALEVCELCITPVQYLSASVLKDVVEIIMNAHEDNYADYTVTHLINKCQQILSRNFSTHPPCLMKSMRKYYNIFLMSPMDLKDNTFTNRSQFGCDKGIVKYCMNRLEYEISNESKDDALVDKYENIPDEMKQSVKGLHWQKEKFEIFELLNRPARIERLMAVLESVIELLQFDLAIWHSRYTNNLGSHIMRSHKPLMAYILWSNNVLYTGAVNNNCRQIFKLFVYLIHLQYPEEHVRIMTSWLNTMVQTFYICETNSNSDYPNTGKYCMAFSTEFYKVISEMPQATIIRVLERIQPSFIQYLIGILHIKTLLHTQEDDIIKIMIDFVKNLQWQIFPESKHEIVISKETVLKPRKVNRVLKYLSKKCKVWKSSYLLPEKKHNNLYPKLDPLTTVNSSSVDQNYVLHTLYTTLDAYLDAYNVQYVQETIDTLNERLLQKGSEELEILKPLSEFCSYSVTENFIKKYRSIYQMLKELMIILIDMKNKGQLPEVMKIFESIGLLGL